MDSMLQAPVSMQRSEAIEIVRYHLNSLNARLFDAPFVQCDPEPIPPPTPCSVEPSQTTSSVPPQSPCSGQNSQTTSNAASSSPMAMPSKAAGVTKKRKRANEAERRHQRGTITDVEEEVLRDLLGPLDASQKPKFADVAREWQKQCPNFQGSMDWLHYTVRTRWEKMTGLGTARRKKPKVHRETVDPILPPLLTTSTQERCNEEIRKWQDAMPSLWPQRAPPPLLILAPRTQSPKDVPDDFRVKMLNYRSHHLAALKYSNALDPMTTAASACL